MDSRMMIRFASFLASLVISYAATANEVRITKDIPFIDVAHKGRMVRIQRIQDTENRLIDDFTKTSRPCPPFCIHPISAAPGVDTVGELEILGFLANEVKKGQGILIDARMPEWHKAETIPGSLNIPFVVLKEANPFMEKILLALGCNRAADGNWNFENAKTLVLFCNGPWCDQSPQAIKGLMHYGYPVKKLKYYRGGMNLWRLFGLTTAVSKDSVID